MPQYFWPDLSLVAYASVSFAIAVLLRRARLAEFDWGAPGMRGTGGTYREVRDDETLAQNAANISHTALSNASPGLAAALLVLAVGVAGAFAAISVIPASFGAARAPSTLNVVCLLVAALSIGFALARLTLTLISVGFALAVLGCILAVVAALLLFAVSFLTGGDYLQSAFRFGEEQWSRLGKDAKFDIETAFDGRAIYNICLVKASLHSVGKMELVDRECTSARDGARLARERRRAAAPAEVGAGGAFSAVHATGTHGVGPSAAKAATAAPVADGAEPFLRQARMVRDLSLQGSRSFPAPPAANGPGSPAGAFPYQWNVFDHGGRYAQLSNLNEQSARRLASALNPGGAVMKFVGANASGGYAPYVLYADDAKFTLIVPFGSMP